MKNLHLVLVIAAIFVCSAGRIFAGDAKSDLKELIGKVQEKLKAGKDKETDFADELKEFDKLAEAHKSEKTDEAARIPFMKAMLYVEIFDDYDKATALLEHLKTDYPGTKPAEEAQSVIKQLDARIAAKKIQAQLVPGKPFPNFEEKDLDGKPLSISAYKGKILLVDFWATWCGPCVGELPNVIKTYEKHHGDGFEIIGVSLDQDKGKLASFIAEKKMPWQQYFDGQGWQNKLAQKYGIQAIPATFLLDKEGNILARDVRGEQLETAVAKAVGK